VSSGLVLDGVAIDLAGRRLVELPHLHVAPGAVVTIMGPSGSGKSTLLAWLCGSLDPAFAARGRATLDGRRLDTAPARERRLGILFQDDLLFPHMSVGQNIAFALPAAVRDRGERRGRVEAALAEAGLDGFAARDPATLSGGQRARVALMRTLAAEPGALLLDEPFGKLDAALRDRFRALVFDHAARRRLPVLLVTHDAADAAAAGGAIVQVGTAAPAGRA
jgi:putative thiamine transport system ATP-binding protein